MSRKNIIAIIVFIVVAAITLIAFLLFLRDSAPTPDDPGPGTTAPRNQETFSCVLTGEEVSPEPFTPPFAACVDNIAQARPQSGLDKADMVYEVLAEGGIPRFLAIFSCEDAERIGPIRSARTYLISLARQFNAILVHAGGSPQALEQIRDGQIRSLNQFDFTKTYFRDPSRTPPHNLFTNTFRLKNAAESAGFIGPEEVEGLQFGGDRIGGTQASMITVRLLTTIVTYRYDSEAGVYLRFMNGQPHRDAITGEQLSAKNVIIQFAEHRVIDPAGRLEIELTGSGRAIFFVNGRRVEGRWLRQSESEPFSYEDSDGAGFVFMPGQTWVEILEMNIASRDILRR